MLVILLFLSFVLVVFPKMGIIKAEPNTIVVPDDYTTIQEAIDNAVAGDTIYVKQGIYHENIGIAKPVSLIGEDRDSTIIDGAPSEGYRVPISIKCDRVNLSGFTLCYGYAGIQIGEVKFCSISGNKITGATFGIRSFKSSSNNITGNIFESIGLGSAIRLEYATQNLIHRNYISSSVEGIQIMQSSNYNTVSENTIVNCKDPGIRLQNSDWNTVTRNTIKNSGAGISIYIANNNFVQNNNFVDNIMEVAADEWYARQWGYGYSLNSWKENYWSDYNGTDNDGDGIGDTPYIINEVNQDNYPLMEPVIIPEFPASKVSDPSNNWSEVTRFSGEGGISTTEHFTCDHVDWRIRWEYEPRTDNPAGSALLVYVYSYDGSFMRDHWFESIIKRGIGETNGILYIYNKNGTFNLDVLASTAGYTLIIEQNLDSIPEFPSWAILPVLFIASLTVILGRKRVVRGSSE